MSMTDVNVTVYNNVTCVLCEWCDSMGGEWSFDKMITSPKYGCYDFAYDPT